MTDVMASILTDASARSDASVERLFVDKAEAAEAWFSKELL